MIVLKVFKEIFFLIFVVNHVLPIEFFCFVSGVWASLVVAHGLSCLEACGVLVLKIRHQTHFPCIRQQILNYWTIKEVFHYSFNF